VTSGTVTSGTGNDQAMPYVVVRNDEEQYSIWPDGHDLPAGWHAAGFAGPKDACLAHIETVWTDLRPRSLRPV
jgi:MbtH protein